jgi:hypothetical protein
MKVSGSPSVYRLFTPGDAAPGTQWIGDWVGPRAGLDAVENRKITFPMLGTERRFLGPPTCDIVPIIIEV